MLEDFRGAPCWVDVATRDADEMFGDPFAEACVRLFERLAMRETHRVQKADGDAVRAAPVREVRGRLPDAGLKVGSGLGRDVCQRLVGKFLDEEEKTMHF
jgi:hypothetical protein